MIPGGDTDGQQRRSQQRRRQSGHTCLTIAAGIGPAAAAPLQGGGPGFARLPEKGTRTKCPEFPSLASPGEACRSPTPPGGVPGPPGWLAPPTRTGNNSEIRLKEGFKKAGKKLDMGKACIRFHRAEDLALDAVAKAVASTPLTQFVAYAERRGKR